MTYSEFIDKIIKSRGQWNIANGAYYEKHHIIPRCLGGADSIENIIYLYADEHYIAHKLLCLENPQNEKLAYAWWMMHRINRWQDRICSEENYKMAKEIFSQMMSKKMSDGNSPFCYMNHSGENNGHYGKKHSIETKNRLRELRLGKPMSEDTKRKISETHKKIGCTHHQTGIPLTEEHRRKVSEGMKNSDKMKRVKVEQYDLDGNFIKLWNSIKEAADFLGKNHSHISQAVYGERKSAYGYKWKLHFMKEEE